MNQSLVKKNIIVAAVAFNILSGYAVADTTNNNANPNNENYMANTTDTSLNTRKADNLNENYNSSNSNSGKTLPGDASMRGTTGRL